jgi:hypothetical protein
MLAVSPAWRVQEPLDRVRMHCDIDCWQTQQLGVGGIPDSTPSSRFSCRTKTAADRRHSHRPQPPANLPHRLPEVCLQRGGTMHKMSTRVPANLARSVPSAWVNQRTLGTLGEGGYCSLKQRIGAAKEIHTPDQPARAVSVGEGMPISSARPPTLAMVVCDAGWCGRTGKTGNCNSVDRCR